MATLLVTASEAAGDVSPPLTPNTLTSAPANLVAVKGVLYFTAGDAAHGVELWRSDGTLGGTTLVKDINSGPSDSAPGELTNVNGNLYFVADDGSHGKELWRSNGTEAGTELVNDINPTADSNPIELTNVDGTLYFTADDGTHGTELWKSKGTIGGASLVRDINKTPDSPASSEPHELSDAGGLLFFTADDGTHGTELWMSNGEESGTTMVKDIGQVPDSSADSHLSWRFPPIISRRLYSLPLYFKADDGTHGLELWKTDGTPEGTELVKDIYPDSTGSNPAGFVRFGGTTFFSAADPDHGIEPWGSGSGGTQILKDINVGTDPSQPVGREISGGIVYFTANDGETAGKHGYALWRSDGTPEGTVLVKDINPGFGWAPGAFLPSEAELTDVNGVLYFSADDEAVGDELWKSEGAGDNTVIAADIDQATGAGSKPRGLTAINDVLFFTADDGTGAGRQLFSLGTPSADNDTDGIANAIDTQPAAPSDEFSDGGAPTYGTIIDRAGLDVSIGDAAYTDGVNISVGAGPGEATLSVCGGFVIKVKAATEALLTCGSVSIQVLKGEAQVGSADGSIVVSVPANGVTRMSEDDSDGSITIENPGEVPLGVISGGSSSTLGPEEEQTIEDSTAPSAPILTATTPASPANDNSPKVVGSAESGSTVKLYTDASCLGAPAATGSAAALASPGLTIGVADNSVTSIRATATDTAGNTSSCSNALSYIEDSSVLARPQVIPPPATTIPAPTTQTAKPKKCKKGFHRKKVKGKAKCVKPKAKKHHKH